MKRGEVHDQESVLLMQAGRLRLYVCPECRRDFRTPEELGGHLNFRGRTGQCAPADAVTPKTEGKPMTDIYKCDQCPKEFDSPWRRGAHKRNAHGDRPRPPKARPAKAAEDGKFKDVIDRLKSKRQDLVDAFVASSPEVAAIDRAIEALGVK